MKFLKLTDPRGHRVMVNQDHIMVLRRPLPGMETEGETEIVLSSGGFQIVKETMDQIWFETD